MSSKFTCPKCNGSAIEEIMVDTTVISEISCIPDTGILEYWEQTNEAGHVDRYQCSGCGFTIVDGDSPHADDGLDGHALVKAIRALNDDKVQSGKVSHEELVQRFADSLRKSDGEYLERLWNQEASDEVVYEGDYIFRWKKE